MNPLIKEHNEKVEQLHELLHWFEKEYRDCDELSAIVQDVRDAAIGIGKLV